MVYTKDLILNIVGSALGIMIGILIAIITIITQIIGICLFVGAIIAITVYGGMLGLIILLVVIYHICTRY